MDLPYILEDWSWSQQSISSIESVVANYLEEPATPDWQKLYEKYPNCGGGETMIFLCNDEESDWVLLEIEDGQWVFVKKGENIGDNLLKGAATLLIKQEETDSYRRWVYYSQGSMDFVTGSLLYLYSQKIERFESVNRNNDVWYFKDGQGKMSFSGTGKSTIIIHTKKK